MDGTGRRTRRALAVGLAAFLVAPLGWSSAGALVGEGGGTPAAGGWPAAWPHDADANGLDDRLEREVAAGASGDVLLHLHYDRRPTTDDARALAALGVARSYVFRNWDDVQVLVPYSRALALVDAPGVATVERVEEARFAVANAMPAVRVTDAAGVVSSPGLDHAFSVHDELGVRGEGMVVAVLDTGIDNTHAALDDLDDDPATFDPKLVHKVDAASGGILWGGVDTSDGFVAVGCLDPPDTISHGTHVAGIAAGTRGGQPSPGAAPAAKLVDVAVANVPVTQPLWIPGVALALDWILDFNAGRTCFGDPGPDRIDVATMSISVSTSAVSSVSRKVTDVVRSGVTVLLAAGNSGSGAGTLDNGPEGAIIVASSNERDTATRDDDALSGFSSRGPRAAADGDGDADALDDLRPDIAAPGSNVLAPLVGSRSLTWSQSGTSMATPLAAGVAALMLQTAPALAPVDAGTNEAMGDAGSVPVRDLMQLTATPKTATEGAAVQHTATGRFGLPWNNGWGYGLLDAYAAVLAARDGVEPPPVACFEVTVATLTVSVDASCSAAPAGSSVASYAWTWGDGSHDAGALPTASHTYATGGDRAVTLTVTAANGRAAATSRVVSVGTGGGGGPTDPDPATPTLVSGVPRRDSVTQVAVAHAETFKINVPGGAAVLHVVLDGPDCGEGGLCVDDLDVRMRPGLPASSGGWACRASGAGNDHECAVAAPAPGWWTVQVTQRAHQETTRFSASGLVPESSYELTATVT